MLFSGKLRMYVTARCENPDVYICLLESNTVLSNLMMLLYGNSVYFYLQTLKISHFSWDLSRFGRAGEYRYTQVMSESRSVLQQLRTEPRHKDTSFL